MFSSIQLKACIQYIFSHTHARTYRHQHCDGEIDPRVNAFLIAISQCFGSQCMHLKTWTQVHVHRHIHTHTVKRLRYAHTPMHTQDENTPDSGLRELTKRENPADISSPLKSTHNDDRIGLPMEISCNGAHKHTHAHTFTHAHTQWNTYKVA